MLTVQENDQLTRVGPGTPMGELMRRYWHPIAAVSQMKSRWTMPIRLLGEDLVLYKDRSGIFGLIEPHCPHRRMGLIYGIPEEHGLRCAYHGWKFDETGRCLEQPYEEAEDPESTYKDKVRAMTYPVEQLAGLLFAYLGPQPAPLLPRWDVFAVKGSVRDIGHAVLPCNWLQCQENSLDPIHVEWLHNVFANFVAEQLGLPQMQAQQWHHAKIDFVRYAYGIQKLRVLAGPSEEGSGPKEGPPIVFPNMLRNGGSGTPAEGLVEERPDGYYLARATGPSFQIRVPIDDTHTAHWWVENFLRKPDEPEQNPEDVPFFQPPVPALDENGLPRWEMLDSNSAQDPAAWITQGDIADRTKENLGRSDKGIIMFRRMLEENMRIVEDGADPMNVFRDPAGNVFLAVHTGLPERGGYSNSPFPRNGQATKYSPILTQREGATKLQ